MTAFFQNDNTSSRQLLNITDPKEEKAITNFFVSTYGEMDEYDQIKRDNILHIWTTDRGFVVDEDFVDLEYVKSIISGMGIKVITIDDISRNANSFNEIVNSRVIEDEGIY